MKRKAMVCCLALALTLALCAPAGAAGGNSRAEALHGLGLLSGTGGGYGLDRTATRAEGLTMLLRLTGEAREAEAHPANHGFSDVPDWAGGYVAYGVEQGLTSGVGGGRFGSDSLITANQYAAFVLRALGYGDGDFSWETAARKLYDLDVVTAAQLSRWTGGTFRRSDLVDLSYDALRAGTKGGGTLAEALVAKGVFTERAARAAGVWPGTEALPVSLESEPRRPGMGSTPSNQTLDGMGPYDEENAYFILGIDLYRVPLSGGPAVKLASMKDVLPELTPRSELQHLNVYDGGLYFTLYCYDDAYIGGDYYGLWRCDLATGALAQVMPMKGWLWETRLSVLNGAFYYLDSGNEESLWRMELDCSEDVLVQSWPDITDIEYYQDIEPDVTSTAVMTGESLYRQAAGTPLWSPVQGRNLNTVAIERVPLAGGPAQILAQTRCGVPGGGMRVSYWMPHSPIPDGGWVYYLEDWYLTADEKYPHVTPNGVSGVWRMRPDGSGKELLYEIRCPDKDPERYGTSNHADWAKDFTDEQYRAAWREYRRTARLEDYAVCDGSPILLRPGSIMPNSVIDFDVDTIEKVENGALKQIYAAPDPIEMPGSLYHEAGTVSNIRNLFTAPGWIFFTRSDNTLRWVSQEGGLKTGVTTRVQAVYRVRPDGTGLERVTPELLW